MHYDFFQNTRCEYYPCHAGIDPEQFNCLFCYCPLYALGRGCGGNFSYENAACVKDCSACALPHLRGNYALVLQKLSVLIDHVAGEEQARLHTENR